MAEHGLHVIGVDSSPTLISLCRERLPDHEGRRHAFATAPTQIRRYARLG
jgi:hypothetical protein